MDYNIESQRWKPTCIEKEKGEKISYIKNSVPQYMLNYGISKEKAHSMAVNRWAQITTYRAKINKIVNAYNSLWDKTDPMREKCVMLEHIHSDIKIFLAANDNTELLLSPSCPDRDFQAGYNLALTSIKKILQKQSK